MKKLVVFIITTVIIFILFLYSYFSASDYSLNYQINDVKIEETYVKEHKLYHFIFTYNDLEYSVISSDKYTNKRKLINDISIEEEDSKICLIPKSDIINVYPICSMDKELISYQYNDEIKMNNKETFNNINIYDYDSKNYLLWNYSKFLFLNENKKDEIKLFTKEVYSLNLIMQYKNYLVVPDYDNNYSFNKLYMIDVDKLKVNNISLRYDIYFDSNFLGYKDKLIYLYDKKQEQEYYINTKKGKIYRTSNKILINGDWEKASTHKLKNENATFQNDIFYKYKIIDNKLYGYIFDNEYMTKITSQEVKKIVKQDGLNLYYISENVLYKYNPNEGIKALLSYSEWDFNYNNMIFIFD